MLEKCHSCGAATPPSPTGVTHAYLDASPGCWARYGEVLAREYANVQYFAVHAITVDAYSAQHPGHPTPQEINSLNLPWPACMLTLPYVEPVPARRRLRIR
ncbi:MAG: DUF5946 family protein [Cyanobacteria bacterium P01_D01_bin.6]